MSPQEVPRSVSLPVSPESESSDQRLSRKLKKTGAYRDNGEQSTSCASTHSDSLVGLGGGSYGVDTENDDAPSDVSYQSKSTGDSEVDQRGNPAACIFVASLTKGKNDEELNISVSNHFEQWGRLLNVKVLKDWMGRPYAFVQFENMQDAKVALQEAPGTLLDGRNIRCEPARVNRTLCITACDTPLITEDLEGQLETFGKIEDITILHGCSSSNGHAPGDRAYVKYCYRDDAVKAYLTLTKMPQKWYVEWASNLDTLSIGRANGGVGQNAFQLTRTDRTSIFVGNLFEHVTEDELRDRFSQYGKVVHVRIVRKLHGPTPRVFAFVRFNNDSQAKDAIQAENNVLWNEQPLRVSYRESRHSSLNTSQRDLSRRMHEKPHPPGLGVPASGHQYLVSGEVASAPLDEPPAADRNGESPPKGQQAKDIAHRFRPSGDGPPGEAPYSQQYSSMATPPYAGAMSYANLSDEQQQQQQQQQQPTMAGAMQGTEGHRSLSAMYVPGYYDYSGAYYPPMGYYPGVSYGATQQLRQSSMGGYYYMMAPQPVYQAPTAAAGPSYVYAPPRGYSTPPQSPALDRKEKRRASSKKKATAD